MSLLGSLNAAVGGLNAQSAALNNISDNVANSQTIGFKRADTAFINYLTESNAHVHSPGAVVARPEYRNSEQGAVTQSGSPTALAVSGNGLFAVQRPTGPNSFDPQHFYTRVGDFAPDSSGYLVNSTGYALDGWPAVGTTGNAFDTNALQPITISKAPSVPVPTSTVKIAANLPSTPPTAATAYSSTVQIRDAGGNAQNLTLNWSQTGTPNQWNLDVASNSPAATTGPMLVTFGATGANAGTITSIGPAAGAIPTTVPAGSPPAAGTPATIGLTLNFGLGNQAASLNLGSFDRSDGVTQFSGGDYEVTSQSQDGASQGNYTSVTVQPTGNVVINYDNGHSATVAKVPLAAFANPDALQQQDGQAFTATIDSGGANVSAPNTGGTGKLIVGATEGSNVDIAAEFTKMIVAQRAYTANTKVVTTANQMLQDTLNMVPG